MPTESNKSGSESGSVVPSIKWSHFLTGSDDATVGRVSVLSKPAEWHALMVGVLAVIAPGVVVAAGLPSSVASALGPGFAASYVVGRSSKDLAQMADGEISTQHIRDALGEPAYLSTGYVIGLGLVELLRIGQTLGV